jgi:hypothetical protein
MRRAATRIGGHQATARSRAADPARGSQDDLSQTPTPARFCTPRGRAGSAVSRLAVLVGLAALLVLCFGAPAQAGITHPYTGVSFGPGGVETGSFSQVVGVAIAQSSGDVFVFDRGEGGRVYKFDAAGKPVNFSSSATNVIEGVGGAGGLQDEIAVDDSAGPDAGDIYVANGSTVRIYAASGALLGELSGGEMCGVAVGSTGEVYVGVYPGTVRRYKPVSNPVTNANESASMGGVEAVCNVAVDGAGDVYASRYYGGVTKYDALQFGSLSATGTLVDPQGLTLAVDPTNGEVLSDDANKIAQYDGEAEPPTLEGTTGATGTGALSSSYGVAANHSSGKVYAGNSSHVEIFGPAVEVVSASTGAATGLSTSDATLNGSIDPAGTEVTGCHFEYGTEEGALTKTAACEPIPPYTGSTPVAVAAQLTGLSEGTTYHYRVTAANAGGTVDGDERTFATLGPQVLAEYASQTGANSTRLQAYINPNTEATTYHVEYGTNTAYGSSTSPVELAAGEALEFVSVPLHQLHANTTYHARFVAVNGSATTLGPDVTFTTGPTVTNESFTQVGSNSAELSAQIAAGGEATSYRVEYGPTTAYGSSTPPVNLGTSEAPVSVVARLGELLPDTTYHFRFVAITASETEAGSDLVFTTHPATAPGLPDGRGYEMVTPADNQGAEIYSPVGAGFEDETQIPTDYPAFGAEDGDAVSYVGSPTSTGNGSMGAGQGNQFLATRNPGGGWTQTDIQPTGYASPTYWAFSKNLEAGLLESREALTGEAPAEYSDLYVRNNESDSYSPLSTVTPPNRTPSTFGSPLVTGTVEEGSMGRQFAGASEDFTHLLFSANDALASGTVDPGQKANNLYESVDGVLQAVNVLPDGSAAPNASFGSAAYNEVEAKNNFSHVISSDGSRVFWTDMSSKSLYVREDGVRTSLIAEDATYLTASKDGSKVLYTKSGDMFEEDLETAETRDLTPSGEVLGLVGASEDLGYIYFVAEAELAHGATPGRSNLYLLHGGATTFIAALGEQEAEEEELLGYNVYAWQPDIGLRNAEVTPSGQALVFVSKKPLTGYDNVSQEGVVNSQVYVFDASNGQISCASCDPTGEQPVGREGFSRTGGVIPISKHATYQQRVISDDGDRVFFESVQPLVPQAENGKLNVYEWERDGSGTCGYSNGCIYLLSSGASTTASFLVDSSASGDDVFMITRSQLLTSDKNAYNDVYDARVGAVEPAVPTQCSGTGCQGTPATPPVFATPASATFNGVGNFPPVANPASKPKPKPKPKKKTPSCTATKKQKGKNSAKKAKAKPVRCKAKKAVKHTRRQNKGGGR